LHMGDIMTEKTKDFSQSPHPHDGGDYDFTKPVQVAIEGKSPPMEGVDSVGGTTYVPMIHRVLEGQAIPLERNPSRRRRKSRQRAIDKSLSVGEESLYRNLDRRLNTRPENNSDWIPYGASIRPCGKRKRDKNLVS
jgi:hypothetical protein